MRVRPRLSGQVICTRIWGRTVQFSANKVVPPKCPASSHWTSAIMCPDIIEGVQGRRLSLTYAVPVRFWRQRHRRERGWQHTRGVERSLQNVNISCPGVLLFLQVLKRVLEAGIKTPPAGHSFCARVRTGTEVDNAAAAQRRPGYIQVLRECWRNLRLGFCEWRLFMGGWDYLLVRMGNVHVPRCVLIPCTVFVARREEKLHSCIYVTKKVAGSSARRTTTLVADKPEKCGRYRVFGWNSLETCWVEVECVIHVAHNIAQ